ncbi:MAG: hypothetical protein JW797_00235 [Bradymonadales bacterium]|nr:hypothetical protein [Bradymonadales bacterium]
MSTGPGPSGTPDLEVREVHPNGSHRKRRGLFFTPWVIARSLARLVLDRLGPKAVETPLKVIDPFVGEGVLLDAWSREVMDRSDGCPGGSSTEDQHRIVEQLYGADLDGQMLSACAKRLGRQDATWTGWAGSHLKVLDALAAPIVGSTDQETSWSQQYPEVFRQGGFDVVLANPPWEKVRVNDREFFSAIRPGFSRLARIERDREKERLLQDPGVKGEYEAYRLQVGRLGRIARDQYATAKSGGDLDTYKLAVERCLALANLGGMVGMIIPDGLLCDWGARKLRELILCHHSLLDVMRLKTGGALFPEIHANLGVLLLVIAKGRERSRRTFRISSTIRKAEELDRPNFLGLEVALVRASTHHLMIPLLECRQEVDMLRACLAFPALGDWPQSRFQPRREMDMTLHRHLFRGEGGETQRGEVVSPASRPAEAKRPAPDGAHSGPPVIAEGHLAHPVNLGQARRGGDTPGCSPWLEKSPGEGWKDPEEKGGGQNDDLSLVPLLEGKHLAPYRLLPHRWRYRVPRSAARYVDCHRIAWRAVADRAMRRRLVAAWVPPGVALGNSLQFTLGQAEDGMDHLLWLLAWMNSRMAEAQLAWWCTTNNINGFHLLTCRLPLFLPTRENREVVGWAAGLTALGAERSTLPSALLARANRIRSAKERREAIEAIDQFFRRLYKLDETTWGRLVLDRTASVESWAFQR